jgi:hypothetical protein
MVNAGGGAQCELIETDYVGLRNITPVKLLLIGCKARGESILSLTTEMELEQINKDLL